MTQESPIKSKVTDVISRKLSNPSPSESPTEQNGRKKPIPVVSYTINPTHTCLIQHSLHGTHYDFSSYPRLGSESFSDFSKI